MKLVEITLSTGAIRYAHPTKDYTPENPKVRVGGSIVVIRRGKCRIVEGVSGKMLTLREILDINIKITVK